MKNVGRDNVSTEDVVMGKVGVDKAGAGTRVPAMLVTPTVVPSRTLAGLSKTGKAQALQAPVVPAPAAMRLVGTLSVLRKTTPVMPPA